LIFGTANEKIIDTAFELTDFLTSLIKRLMSKLSLE
jgi:hypothetical protein